MVLFVIISNLVIGLICLLSAWQLVKLRRRVARASLVMDSVEHRIQRVLHPAPAYILRGQAGTQNLREQYQRLSCQLAQVQQVMGLLGLGRMLWLRQNRRNPKATLARSRRAE